MYMQLPLLQLLQSKCLCHDFKLKSQDSSHSEQIEVQDNRYTVMAQMCGGPDIVGRAGHPTWVVWTCRQSPHSLLATQFGHTPCILHQTINAQTERPWEREENQPSPSVEDSQIPNRVSNLFFTHTHTLTPCSCGGGKYFSPTQEAGHKAIYVHTVVLCPFLRYEAIPHNQGSGQSRRRDQLQLTLHPG